MEKKISLFASALLVLCLGSLGAQEGRRERGNLVLEGFADPAQELFERYAPYTNTRGAAFGDWDEKGSGMYFLTRFGDVNQVHHVSGPGAYREQITFFSEPVGNVSTRPGRTSPGFSFSRDNGGDENFQYYFFDRKTGKTLLLTDGKSRHTSGRWSFKGDRFVYAGNRRNGADLDIFVMVPGDTSAPRTVAQLSGGGWGIRDWSDDGKWLLITNSISVTNVKMYILEMATGKLEAILPDAPPFAIKDAEFSPDAKSIYLSCDQGTEFATLRLYDRAAKTLTALGGDKWDVEGISVSPDGKTVAFVTNNAGYSVLNYFDVAKQKAGAYKGVPKGVIGGLKWHADGRSIAFSVTTPTAPSDLYVLDVKKQASVRWTFSEVGGLNPATFVAPSLIEYPTFDSLGGKRRTIPSFLYKPQQAKGKLPVIISIHGGPEGQSQPQFNSLAQYWMNELGVAVLVPNVRGSTGYGKTYVSLDNGFLRENSVKDIGALLDWIATQPDLDKDRVAVYGGSYGGYMVLACMTNFNDRLRCGIDLFGISNFVTFLENTSPYRRDLRRVEYGDERDPAMRAHLEKISPNRNIQKITKPMFIYQGKNDPRVPLSESDQMVDALQAQGNTIWYVMAKDEGHSLAKKTNRDYTNAAITMFLKRFLF
jgi:dipeptidyl aminopeptidase/acylaminoacyl peptidase